MPEPEDCDESEEPLKPEEHSEPPEPCYQTLVLELVPTGSGCLKLVRLEGAGARNHRRVLGHQGADGLSVLAQHFGHAAASPSLAIATATGSQARVASSADTKPMELGREEQIQDLEQRI